ncbi:hypothetical protein AMTRI_Chr10g5790 [Amborella trichopoda]|uniref:Uncharacterized protein n=1 Tax=Amborella trichopoda TaxID=13333 RepID=W1NWC9_AMBTC|nr:disease resistance protein RPM1 [Amborella trichopoda]XP_011620913.1 disease resistance protein RPM1 [Amborella trichopoda]ERM99585.1 hypothetical protein AMTR_s00088p00134370 [Amborella trichopoda]|eukprot:XP_006836732.1 disease resistance protein RPM1 [Amborella trichopoda]
MAESAAAFVIEKLGEHLEKNLTLLLEVEGDVQWIKDELESMRVFLKSADKKSDTNEALDAWVRQVRDVAYDAEDALDEFILRMEGTEQLNGCIECLISLAHFVEILRIKHEVGTKIRSIKERAREIFARRTRFNLEKEEMTSNITSSGQESPLANSYSVEDEHLEGIGKKVQMLEGWLVDGDLQVKVISILGMGGLGKTTLAKRIYNMENIRKHFNCCAWVTVSQQFTKIEILNSILKGFSQSHEDEIDEGNLRGKIHACLQDKRYLLVLDDVWSEDVWGWVHTMFPGLVNGSRFLITTRIAEVASPMHVRSMIYSLEPLSKEEAWSLFCKKAFWIEDGNTCPLDLEEEGRQIVKECDGLPLAIVAIGSMMSKKAKTSVEWAKIRRSLAWELNNHPYLEGVRGILSLSFKDLVPLLKYCFFYCCLFPEDFKIRRSKLIRLWVAEGFIEGHEGMTKEEVAGDYFKELLDRNLIHVAKISTSGQVKACRVHDVVRKLGLSLSQKETFGVFQDGRDRKFDKKTRRIAILNSTLCSSAEMEISHLRTLLLFVAYRSIPLYFPQLMHSSQFLRVLDLQGIHMEYLPEEVVHLIHLRYLGLRDTGIKKVPKSLEKLRSLITLDLEGFKGALPSGIFKIQTLTYLNVAQFDVGFVIPLGLRVPNGIGSLMNLQTLGYIRGDSDIVKDLGNLRQLRKLKIQLEKSEAGNELCASVQNMDSLRSLNIASWDADGSPLLVEHISPPQTLEKLSLFGALGHLPYCLKSLPNLLVLYLGFSKLSEDPLLILETMPNLRGLYLRRAYVGKQIGRLSPSGFPKLQRLCLHYLSEVEEWGEVEEGAMPRLCQLSIHSCKKLRALPQGFQGLRALKELFITSMENDFVLRLECADGEDRSKVQHVAEVWINGKQMNK